MGYFGTESLWGRMEGQNTAGVDMPYSIATEKIDANLLQSLMGGVKTKLRAIADSGVLATYKK